jgi:hypothetical protein
MRKTRVGMRIYVQGVPLDTTWFCPYCCATVDTGFITLQKHSKQNADARSPYSSIGYSRSALSLRETYVLGRNYNVTRVGCIVPRQQSR